MTTTVFKKTIVAGAGLAAILLTGILISPPRGQAQSGNGNSFGADQLQRIQQGLAIAPVYLNLKGKTPNQINLVGMGSYLVNAVGDCNGCHTSGGPPNFNYLAGNNPYFLLQGPTKVDPNTYLGGGADFG